MRTGRVMIPLCVFSMWSTPTPPPPPNWHPSLVITVHQEVEGKRGRRACMFTISFFHLLKTYLAAATKGFPPSIFTKHMWKVSDRRKSFRHRHLLRVSLLAHHHSALLRAPKWHPMDMPFHCPLFPAFLKQDKTPFVGSSLACHHPHPSSNDKAPLLSFVPF